MTFEKSILMKAPIGILVLDGPGLTVEWSNDFYNKMCGTRLSRGNAFLAQWPELDSPQIRARLVEAAETKTNIKLEEVTIGTSVPQYFNISVQPSDGKLLVTMDDVTPIAARSRKLEHEKNDEEQKQRSLTTKLLDREATTLQAFKEREETFRLLVENSKDGISLTDKGGFNIYFSPAAENILGFKESEMIGKHGFEQIHPDDQARLPEIFADFAPGKSVDYEMRVRHKNGNYCWLELTTTNLFHVAGIEAIVSNFRDITSRKQHEQEAVQRQREFQELANAMPQLVWIADGDGRVTYYNERISEYGGAEKKGDTWEWRPLIHPDDVQKTAEAWMRSVATRTVYAIEHRVQMRDGSYRFHLSRAYPQFDESGNVIKWFGTGTDIAEQKQAQLLLEQYAVELAGKIEDRTKELTQQIAFTQTILDSAIDVMGVYDSSFKLVMANKRYYEKFGFPKDGTEGRTYSELFPHDAVGLERLSKSFEGEQQFYPAHKSFYSDRYFETYIVPLSDAAGKVYAVLVIAHDVTQSILYAGQLEAANESLMKQNEELEQFAYVASHDLQEPLRKITTFARMIEKAELDQGDAPRYIQKIIQSSNRMSELIRDVLKFSQLNRSESFQMVDLNYVLDNILMDFELLIEQKSASFSYEKLPVIEAVPRQMSQLFYNLISNALKFSRPNVPVNIRIRCSKIKGVSPNDSSIEYFRISFADNGIGFNQTYADKIFMMFQRLNTREQFSGSGIGLAMVKKIISNHHGYIVAEGEEGKGATFHVILPEKQPDPR